MGTVIAFMLLLAAPTSTTVDGWIIEESVLLEMPDAPPEKGSQTTWITATAVKRSASSRPQTVLIDSSSPVPFRMLDPLEKTWFGYPQSTIAKGDLGSPLFEGIAIGPDGAPSNLDDPFRASGRTGKVGAWSASEWISSGDGLADSTTAIWVADRPAGLPNDAITRVQREVFSRKGSRWEPYLQAMGQIPGFPVRTVLTWTEAGRNAKVTLTVTKIRAAKIEKSELALPSGWRQVDDPLGILPSTDAKKP